MIPSVSEGSGFPNSANAAANSARSGSSSDGTELTDELRCGDELRTLFQEGWSVPGSNSAFFLRAKPRRQ